MLEQSNEIADQRRPGEILRSRGNGAQMPADVVCPHVGLGINVSLEDPDGRRSVFAFPMTDLRNCVRRGERGRK
jgi:hypothetical protein